MSQPMSQNLAHWSAKGARLSLSIFPQPVPHPRSSGSCAPVQASVLRPSALDPCPDLLSLRIRRDGFVIAEVVHFGLKF